MRTPSPWHELAPHGVLAETTHDDIARFNAIANLKTFLAQAVAPQLQAHYEQRLRPQFHMRHGRDPANRAEVESLLATDDQYRSWSTLRRNAMELRQHVGRELVQRQLQQLAARARQLNAGSPRLRLDPTLTMPRYVANVDVHLMAGGYTTEQVADDVAPAANYDAGFFATVGGSAGPHNDAAGRALVAWLQRERPAFKPQRIVDLGCGLGHNTLPVRRAFPDAEIIAIDVAAPMLRYGHARAASLGIHDIDFWQQDATQTSLPDASADLVFSTMVLHETSAAALPRLLAESRRLLRAGGLTIHLEQPPYRGMQPYEQFMRDWDGRYNNEPFWTALHEMSLPDALQRAGFAPEHISEARCTASTEANSGSTAEDYGRAPSWYAAVAELPASVDLRPATASASNAVIADASTAHG